MVNVGLNSAAILGIFLAVAGAGLYFLRSVRPELARDQDIFFAAAGLLCGFILVFQGWRLDPILQFGQFILTATAVYYAYEAIRLRGIATEQARRSAPIVDEDRPVSKVYRTQAELDDLEQIEDRYANRRLRGSDDPRDSRTARYEDETRRPRSRGSSERLRPAPENPPRRRPRPTSRPSEPPAPSWEASLDERWEEKPSRTRRSPRRSTESWQESLGETYEEEPPRPSRSPGYSTESWQDNLGESYEEEPPRPSRSRPTRPERPYADTEPKPRQRRPSPDEVSSPYATDVEPPTTDVDYQPIDEIEEQEDSTRDFDY